MIKRYGIIGVESESGPWVKYDDYKAEIDATKKAMLLLAKAADERIELNAKIKRLEKEIQQMSGRRPNGEFSIY